MPNLSGAEMSRNHKNQTKNAKTWEIIFDGYSGLLALKVPQKYVYLQRMLSKNMAQVMKILINQNLS